MIDRIFSAFQSDTAWTHLARRRLGEILIERGKLDAAGARARAAPAAGVRRKARRAAGHARRRAPSATSPRRWPRSSTCRWSTPAATRSSRSSRSASRRGSCASRARCRCARTRTSWRSRWPIRPTATRSARSRWSPAATVRPLVAIPTELEAALERLYGARQVGAGPDRRRRRDARRRARLRRRRPAAEGPRVRGAGDPAGHRCIITNALDTRASDIHIEPFENRLIVRYRDRRRAARGRVAAAAPVRGGDLAHQDHGQPRHRRAPAAAGRPHPAARAGQGDRPARVDGADDARRVGGDADPRQGRRRARFRSGSASRTTRSKTFLDVLLRAARHPARHRARPAAARRRRCTRRSTA